MAELAVPVLTHSDRRSVKDFLLVIELLFLVANCGIFRGNRNKKTLLSELEAAPLFPGTESAKAAPVHSKLSREHLLKRMTQKPYASTSKKLFPRGRVFEDPAIPYTAAELHGLFLR